MENKQIVYIRKEEEVPKTFMNWYMNTKLNL